MEVNTETVTTLYGDIDKSVYQQLANTKLLVLDVDGVLSDGYIYMGNDGEELKTFNTKDGYGIKAVISQGVEVAVITGRRSNIVEKRMTSLHCQHIIQGEENKAQALSSLMDSLGLKRDEVTSVGDDMPDIGLFELSGNRVAVKDAHPHIRNTATYVTSLDGGRGAVREVCDIILQAKGVLNDILGASV